MAHVVRKGRKASRAGESRLATTDEVVVRVPVSSQQVDRLHMRHADNLYTDAFGSYLWGATGNVYRSLNNFLTTSPDYSALTSMWKQYRLLSVRISLIPRNRYSKATTSTSAFGLGVDLSSATAAPSWATAVQNTTTRVLTCDEPAEIVFEIPQDASNVWYNFGTGVTPGCIFLSLPPGGPLSSSITYFDVIVDVVALVRGRS